VHERIADKFLKALVDATNKLKVMTAIFSPRDRESDNSSQVGPGNQPDVYLGPIQNDMQYNRVKDFFGDIEKDKLKVAVGGKIPEGKGYFINPTIIDRPGPDSRIVKEEPFGQYNDF